jgi:gamma-glutamyl:cysteine ligase YbdK (ATP-grasp superfamily)
MMQLSLLLGPVFVAGIAAGVLVVFLLDYYRLGKRHHTDLVKARSRIIASIKQEHEEEILRQIFQTVELIHGDTRKSVSRLVDRLEDLLTELQGKQSARNIKATGDGNKPERIESL